MQNEIQEHEVIAALESQGLHYQVGHRYILSQCPMPEHDDRSPSVQIFKDDWFMNCMAGCGRSHVTKAFPHLRDESLHNKTYEQSRPAYHSNKKESTQKTSAMNYKQFDLMEQWKCLPMIPDHINLKGISAEYLNEIGWRWTNGELGMGTGIFIPYFDNTKTSIPFGQVRHAKDSPIRFHFLKDAQPKMYGTWNLEPGKSIFIVEGCSDWLVMEYCGIPSVAVPSSSQTSLLKKMAQHCKTAGIDLIYAGDNDEAGDKLRHALDEGEYLYTVCQPPKGFNDWSDFFTAHTLTQGADAISNRCMPYLYGETQPQKDDSIKLDIDLTMTEDEKKTLLGVMEIFGEGTKIIYRQ